MPTWSPVTSSRLTLLRLSPSASQSPRMLLRVPPTRPRTLLMKPKALAMVPRNLLMPKTLLMVPRNLLMAEALLIAEGSAEGAEGDSPAE